MSEEHPVRLVAITGGSGAGKTWLADRLHRLMGNRTGRLSQDSYYRDWSHLPPAARAGVNFDHPDALDWPLFAEALDALRRGRGCRLPVYDFATHCRAAEGELLRPRPLMIVDGLWLLHHPEVRRQFDLSIYFHCTEEERLRRRIARDTVDRGRTAASVEQQFRATVAPMHRQFVNPQAAHADLLLHHPCRESELLLLQERLHRLMPAGAGRLAALFHPLTPSLARAAGASSL
jgi:uridine kinase